MTLKETKIVKIDPLEPDKRLISEMAEILRSGGTVAFPTETVYGIGANALDPVALSGIFEAKGRPYDNPLIVHIADISRIEEIARDIPDIAFKLMERFWPGPLTLVLKRSPQIPKTVTANLDTVAVRAPLHRIAYELILESNLPIAAPSANASGRPSPTNASHVIDDLSGKVDAIIDGGQTKIGLESTVLDLTSEAPVILRPGGVTKEELEEVLGAPLGEASGDPVAGVLEDPLHHIPNVPDLAPGTMIPKSPGTKYRHYAPKAKMILLSGSLEQIAARIRIIADDRNMSSFSSSGADQKKRKTVGVLATSELIDLLSPDDTIFPVRIGSTGSYESLAVNLFDSLRKMDESDVDLILSECIPVEGLGVAIMDRLTRAASGCVINVGDIREIMFVCTGNICRSCMAEAFFNDSHSQVFASSAGVYAFDGDEASSGSSDVMRDLWGISLANHRARYLRREMVEKPDLILTMAESHKKSILQKCPDSFGKVFTLLEYTGCHTPGYNIDIADPYGYGISVYTECAAQIKAAVDKLAELIQGRT